jgi:hypothetical protein
VFKNQEQIVTEFLGNTTNESLESQNLFRVNLAECPDNKAGLKNPAFTILMKNF